MYLTQSILFMSTYMQGSYGCLKSLKVLEFWWCVFKVWKVLEFWIKCLKILEIVTVFLLQQIPICLLNGEIKWRVYIFAWLRIASIDRKIVMCRSWTIRSFWTSLKYDSGQRVISESDSFILCWPRMRNIS